MNQVQSDTLRNLGYTGALNDMLLKYYIDNGASTRVLNQAAYEFLAGQGYTTGSLNDRWKAFLVGQGYTGTLVEALIQWWLAGASVALVDWDASTRWDGSTQWR
jgi:hypothetical protein